MPWLRDNSFYRGLAVICAMAIAPGDLLLQPRAQAQNQPPPGEQAQLLGPDQLDSLVAPIALYPDSLLAQALAASTYPMDIVKADRWMQENTSLKGKALTMAAGKQDWDPSVQALTAFPEVLKMMDQSLDWTTALGNAFLAQQADVMSAVQRMRMKAEKSGKLASTPQQTVQTTMEQGQPTVVIQPADPEVVYVPSYEPAAVYGAAPAYYPYPAVSYPSTGEVWAAGAISFGLGIAVGAIFNGGYSGWGWGCSWGPRPSLYVNNNFFARNSNAFVNRTHWGNNYRGSGTAGWNHNPYHRGAVPYSNRAVANRYNAQRPVGRQGLAEMNRPGQQPIRPPANAGNIRPGTGQGNIRPGTGQGTANRLPANRGPGQANISRPSQGNIARPSQGNAARQGGRQSAGVARPSQQPRNKGSASRSAGGAPQQWGNFSGSRPGGGSQSMNRGAFGGGNARQARASSNRGFSSMGGGGGRRGGGGGSRGGGRGGGGRRR